MNTVYIDWNDAKSDQKLKAHMIHLSTEQPPARHSSKTHRDNVHQRTENLLLYLHHNNYESRQCTITHTSLFL